MIIHRCEQRSDEWFELRRGKITGTGFQMVQAKGRGGGPSKTRKDYMEKLCIEKVCNITIKNKFKTTGPMQDGTEREDESISVYEDDQLIIVGRVGFVEIDEWMGISPDGLIGDDGGLEIKNPLITTHFKYLKNKQELLNDYKWQVNGSLMATGRKWWDLVSYHPDAFPDGKDRRLCILRVKRDEKICDDLRYECDKFIEELKKEIEESRNV